MDNTWTLLKSTNGGLNWVSAVYVGDNIQRIYTFGNTVIAAAISRIAKSTDDGVTWSIIDVSGYHVGADYSFINENTGWSCIGQLLPPPNPNNYINNYICKTTDGGVTWQVLNTAQSTFMPMYNNLYFASENTGYIAGTGGFRRTTNGGINWVVLPGGSQKIYAFNNDTVFAGGGIYPSTIERTTNGGINWIHDTIGTGTPISEVFLINRNTGWAAGDSGRVFVTSSAIIGNISYISNVPKNFSLSQNYPNPFNPSTKIQFALPKSSLAKIVVYDLLGREIETVVNEQLNAGTYEADFDGGKLSSGVYYYKLTAGDFSETKKMVLIK
jgi:photosystem II stability/assembly factor-like uncharacterized protein